MMRGIRISLGLLFWIALLGVAAWRAGRPASVHRQHVQRELRDYVAGQRRHIRVRIPRGTRLSPGDPVFVRQGDKLIHVGEVRTVPRAPAGGESLLRGPDEEAGMVLYPACPPVHSTSILTLYRTDDTIAWVARTLLPQDRRDQVLAEINRALEAHQDEVLRSLRPVVERTLFEAFQIVRDDIGTVLASHQQELEELGQRYQSRVLEEQLMPVVQREIWPAVQVQAEPVATQIGQELWGRLSLWRFSWRMTYDWLPLPNRDLTQKEWKRFLREEVRPVLAEHQGDFLAVLQQVVYTTAQNQNVQAVLSGGLTHLIQDPQFLEVLRSVVDELVIHNGHLQALLERRWQDDDTQQALRMLVKRAEPVAQRIGRMVLGSIEDGLTDEFTRVLRVQVLGKDRRWLLLEPGSSTSVAEVSRMALRFPSPVTE